MEGLNPNGESLGASERRREKYLLYHTPHASKLWREQAPPSAIMSTMIGCHAASPEIVFGMPEVERGRRVSTVGLGAPFSSLRPRNETPPTIQAKCCLPSRPPSLNFVESSTAPVSPVRGTRLKEPQEW